MSPASLNSAKQSPFSRNPEILTEALIPSVVGEVLASTPVIDIHTHLYPPAFGKLGLWGIDELLTYHYLEAELFRSSNIKPHEYWLLSKRERAEAIWQALFVENTPVSEATRGVIAVLHAFHLPTDRSDLAEARSFFEDQTFESHIQRVLEIAGLAEWSHKQQPISRRITPGSNSLRLASPLAGVSQPRL